MKPIASVLACVAAAALAADVCAAAEKELPVTRATAFSSSVAYFEHSGKVTGDAKVLLKFKAEQINDILKSTLKLVSPAKPTEKTPKYYRFEVDVPPRRSARPSPRPSGESRP